MTAPPTAGRPDALSRATRVATASVAASVALSVVNIAVGVSAESTSVFAIGFEFAGDVLASAVVLVGLQLASRPADDNHPYGHGRLETVAGLFVGFILVAGGAGVAYHSLLALGEHRAPPGEIALWVLALAVAVRGFMSATKFRVGREIGSTSLVADAWSDAVDILSAVVALVAVGLARLDPIHFLAADRYGGVVVGLVVIITGLRVVRDASFDLVDTMPDHVLTEEVRRVAMSVPGVLGVEKQFARKTGFRYHVDLHLEVDPDLTVRASHELGHEVQRKVQAELTWVAHVLVHIEPAPSAGAHS